jgi:hypothetical protein
MGKHLKLFFIIGVSFFLSYCTQKKAPSSFTGKCYVYEHTFEFGQPDKEGRLLELRYYIDTLMVKKQLVNKRRRKRDYFLYKYNDNGRRTDIKRFSRRHLLLSHTKYRYDEKGRLYLKQVYDAHGKLLTKKEWIFSEDSKQWEMWTEYNPEGIMRRTEITAFNAKGQRLSGSIYSKDLKKFSDFKIAERDSLGNEVLNVFFKPNGDLMARIIRKYDAQNRLIFEHYETKYKKTMTYDGNWLIKETFYDLFTDEKQKLKRYVYVFE